MKKGLRNFLTASAVAAIGYKIAKDTGLADRIIYKKEYEAAKRYINSHHPHSKFTNLEKTDTGFVCVVTKPDNSQILLIMTLANEGIYIFAEKRL